MSGVTWQVELLFPLLPHYLINILSIHVTDWTSFPESLCYIVWRSRTAAVATSWIMMVDRRLGSWTTDHYGGSRITHRDGDPAADRGSWWWIKMTDRRYWWHLIVVVMDPDRGLWLQQDCLKNNTPTHILTLLTTTSQLICNCCSLHLYKTFSYV